MRDDHGFFAVDRAAMRRAMQELDDGRTFGFFLALTIDANGRAFPSGSPREIAAYFALSVKGVTAMLTALDDRGWIDWVKPTNQYADGRLNIVRDLERARPETGRGNRVAGTRASTRADALPTPESVEASWGNEHNKEQRTENREHPPPAPAAYSHLARLSAEEEEQQQQQRRTSSNGPRSGAADPQPLTKNLDEWARRLGEPS